MPTDPLTDNGIDSVVVPVHGTFAASMDHHGSAWWQLGSDFQRRLTERLGHRFHWSQFTTFHWSGANLEAERSRAAKELLDHFARLDQAGVHYHVIAHSHGANVVWEALRKAVSNGRMKRSPVLPGFRSWTTIGAPFFHYYTRGWRRSLAGLILGVLSVMGLFVVDTGRYSSASETMVFTGLFVAICLLATVDRLSAVLALQTVFFGSLEAFLWPALPQWLSTVAEVAITTAIVGLLARAAVVCWRGLKEFQEGGSAPSRADLRAVRSWGPLWTGIWSPEDEAIGALQAAVALARSAERSSTEPRTSTPIELVRLLRRAPQVILSKLGRQWVKKKVLGLADRGFSGVQRVSTHPQWARR